MLDGQPLKLEVEYMSFITRISLSGEIVNLRTQGGGIMTIEEYTNTYCTSRTHKVGFQVPFQNIEILRGSGADHPIGDAERVLHNI
jgi:hypothetical protein